MENLYRLKEITLSMSVIKRRLTILMGSALAVLAVAAAPAAAYPAAGEFEVTHPTTGAPCPQVTAFTGKAVGGCVVPVTNTEPMKYVGVNSKIGFDLHFNDDGWVYASDVNLTGWTPGSWTVGPLWWGDGPEAVLSDVDSWMGYLQKGPSGGVQIALFANFTTPTSPYYFREAFVLNLSHGGAKGGLHLANDLQKMQKSEGWYTEPYDHRTYYKGQWDSAADVDIDVN